MTQSDTNNTPNFPTQEEIAEMEKNFGNLPEWAKKVPFSSVTEEAPLPIKYSEVDFDGFDHKPIAYTFDFTQNLFWMQRYLFLDDIEHLTQSKIPVNDYMMVAFSEEKVLRVNFMYEVDEDGNEGDTVYAQIISVSQDVEEQSGRACIELVVPISSIEVVEGLVVAEGSADNVQ